MEYLRQNTDIPIPRVHSWGFLAESPQHLGSFIIMDYVQSTLLSTILKQPDQDDMLLNPNIDNATLDKIYHQIAYYIFQLSQLTFTSIGAVSKDHASSAWHVTGRPLTYNMNELATFDGYLDGQFPAAPFDRASGYLRSVAHEHLIHLWTQPNLADDAEIAQQRFTHDPPWWLLLSGPEMWLERCAMDEFLTLYEPRMERFLRALERVETEMISKVQQPGGPSLSTRIFMEDWAGLVRLCGKKEL